jgi:hypothetical protein
LKQGKPATRMAGKIGFVLAESERVSYSYSFVRAGVMFIFVFRKLGSFYIFWLATKHLFATEANFSLHRIKNQDGRVFDIEFSKSGRMEGPLTSRGGCAFVAKFRGFSISQNL